MGKQKYLARNNYLLLLPLLIFLLVALIYNLPDTTLTLIFISLALLTAISSLVFIYAYIVQIQYIRTAYPGKRLIGQCILPPAALVIPTLAVILGDRRGIAAFGDGGSGSFVIAGIYIGLGFGFMALWLMALGNMIYIKTGGKNTMLSMLGKIGHGVLWLIIAFISYVFYAFAFTARDPNTE